ncbi:MAG: hypothetical protein ACHQNA_11645, partial [Acidimicrobiales bacterium]
AKDGPKVNYGEQDTVTLAGGPGNQGYGDVNTKTNETSFGKSARDLQKGATDAPVRTAAGAVTGGTPLLAQQDEVVGMKLNDADFNRLTAAASSSKAWTRGFLDSGSQVNQSHAAALRLQRRVQEANGDRAAIAKAFAEYAKDNDHAAKFVQELVRPSGETEGGRRYDWPAEYVGEQSVYESLVLGDPGAEADTLANSGQTPAAVQKLQDSITQLGKVADTVNTNRDRFSDKAAVSEMLRSMRRRQRDLSTKIRQLQPAALPQAAKVDPANHDPAKTTTATTDTGAAATTPPPVQEDTKAAPDPATVSRDTDQLRGYIKDCQTNRADEQARFATIDAEYHHWYRGPSASTILPMLTDIHDRLYPQWEKQIKDMKDLYKEMGQDPNQAVQYGPDRAGWRQRRNNPEMTKWGSSWQGD